MSRFGDSHGFVAHKTNSRRKDFACGGFFIEGYSAFCCNVRFYWEILQLSPKWQPIKIQNSFSIRATVNRKIL